jgi:hypothetical protein
MEIPAGDRRIPAGEQQRSGLGPTRVRFVGVIGGEGLPAVGRTGVRRRWPPRLPVRRGGGSVGRGNEAASNNKCKRGW